MWNCRRSRAGLNDFLDGMLPAVQAQRLTAHLEECEVCRSEYHALRRTQELVRGLRAPDGALSQSRVLARFRSELAAVTELEAQRSPRSWRGARVRLEIAASAFACAVLLALYAQSRIAPQRSISGTITLATAASPAALPTARDLDQMVSLHAVNSFPVLVGNEEMAREALADANADMRDIGGTD